MPKTEHPDRPEPLTLSTMLQICPVCGHDMLAAYHNPRRICTRTGTLSLRLQVRRCKNQACPRFKSPHRPELETRLYLPYYKFGLDVLWRVAIETHFRSADARYIHSSLVQQGVQISLRTVRNLLTCYYFLKERSIADDEGLMECLNVQGYVVLDVFRVHGQPHQPRDFFIIRDFLSGNIFRARYIHRLETSTCEVAEVLADVLDGVCDTLPVPIRAFVSDQPKLPQEITDVLRVYSSDLPANTHCMRWSIASPYDSSEQEACSAFLTRVVSDATAGRSA